MKLTLPITMFPLPFPTARKAICNIQILVKLHTLLQDTIIYTWHTEVCIEQKIKDLIEQN